MDKFDKITLAKYRLETAREDLQTAKIDYDNNMYKGAANRAYYAIFHSLRAVLSLDEKDFKKHSAIIAYFNQNYIRTKIFPEIHNIISKASLIRNSSDYDDFYIVSKDEAKEQINNAIYILELVEKYVNQQLWTKKIF